MYAKTNNNIYFSIPTGFRLPSDLLVKDCTPLVSPKVVPNELFNGLSPPTGAGRELPNPLPGCPRNGARASVFRGPREDPRLVLFV
jgi:hypothetical protein